MDAKDFRSSQERTIGRSVDYAGIFAHANAEKNVGFFSSNFFRIFESSSKRAKFISRFFRSDVLANFTVGMLDSYVLLRRNPFQVVGVVVSFVVIPVMNMMGMQRFFKPAKSNHPMDQATTSNIQVSIWTKIWREWNEFPQNIPAPRNGIQRTEESVLHPFYRYAQRGVSFEFSHG